MNSTLQPRQYWWALLITTVFLCLPILTVTYFPLVDWANHLARLQILHDYNQTPIYQELYYVAYEPIPNVAMDFIILLLLKFTDVVTAGKIFLLITVLLFVAGCHALGKFSLGRLNWMTIPCCFLFYNSLLLWGFGNYLFGLGIFFLTLAFWLQWRERMTFSGFLLVAAMVFVAYLSHLSSYMFLGIAFATLTVQSVVTRSDKLSKLAVSVLPLAPPLFAFAVFMGGSGEVGSIEWGSLLKKLIALAAPLVAYNYFLSGVLLALLTVVAVISFVKAQSIKFNWLLMLPGLMFFVCLLLAPKTLFTSHAVDNRFLLPTLVLILLSLKIEIPGKIGERLLLASVLLLSVHIASIWGVWVILDRQIAAEVERFEVLPEGAKIYPFFVEENPAEENETRRFLHIISYATIVRKAFVPGLFALKGQQPLRFRVPPTDIRTFVGSENSLQNPPDLSEYQYVWTRKMNEPLRRFLNQRGTLIYEADNFTLWQLD